MPAGLACGICVGRCVAKKVDVVWAIRQGLQGVQLGLKGLRAQHGCRQGAQATGLADRSGEPVVLRARHRGLDDGGAQPQAVKKCVHGFTVMVCPEQSGLKNNLTC